MLRRAAVVFLQRGVKHLADERRLAAAAHASNGGHHIQRKADIQVLQVVLAGAVYLNIVAPMAAHGGHLVIEEVFARLAFVGDFAAVPSRSGTNLYRVVCSVNDIFVVLHHHDGVTQVAQLA